MQEQNREGSISALSAAKHIGRRSNWSLTHLEIQKLIYLAHLVYLGNKKKPLVDGLFEAWDYGPVHPHLYHKAKIFGSDPVKNIFRLETDVPKDSLEAEILDAVTDKFSSDKAKLVSITHWDQGAWAKRYVPGARGRLIFNGDILKEYNKRLDAQKERQSRQPAAA